MFEEEVAYADAANVDSAAVLGEQLRILRVKDLRIAKRMKDAMRVEGDAGRYRNAEFAADLAQVARGEGAFEYRDPVEFFARTYVTEGMAGLLTQAVKRASGGDGEPVIQLKTAFGGGKTHSMLALYHLLRGKAPLEKMPNVTPVLDAVGVSSMPAAHVAVLVGTALDPTRANRDVQRILEEIVAHLSQEDGVALELRLEVQATAAKGIGTRTVRTVSENCRTLKITNFGFEET